MAEFDHPIIDKLFDSSENLSKFNDYITQLNDARMSLETDERFNSNPAMQQQYEAVKENLEEVAQQQATQKITVAIDFKEFQNAISKTYNVNPNSINFHLDFKDMPTGQLKFTGDQFTGVGESWIEAQKSVGENGKSIQESPKTLKLLDKLLGETDSEKKMTILSILPFILGALGGLGAFENLVHSSNSIKKIISSSVGCYQKNITTGAIRTMGICGLDCKGDDKVACDAVSSGPCCATCSSNSDCYQFTKTPCRKGVIQDCPGSTCAQDSTDHNQWKCTDQTCVASAGTCDPCPSTNVSVIEQMKKGKISFCNDEYPIGICPAAAVVCSSKKNGGACDECDPSDSSCTGGEGYVVNDKSCMCPGDDWVMAYTCGSPDLLMSTIAYMNKNKEKWVPQPTPLVIKIMFGLTVASFALTFIWYITYLIRHARKS